MANNNSNFQVDYIRYDINGTSPPDAGRRNYYKWLSTAPTESGIESITLVTKVPKPYDFNFLNENKVLSFTSKVDSFVGSGISVELYDTQNNPIYLNNATNVESLGWALTECSVSGLNSLDYTGDAFTMLMTLTSTTNSGCYVSDLNLHYSKK